MTVFFCQSHNSTIVPNRSSRSLGLCSLSLLSFVKDRTSYQKLVFPTTKCESFDRTLVSLPTVREMGSFCVEKGFSLQTNCSRRVYLHQEDAVKIYNVSNDTEECVTLLRELIFACNPIHSPFLLFPHRVLCDEKGRYITFTKYGGSSLCSLSFVQMRSWGFLAHGLACVLKGIEHLQLISLIHNDMHEGNVVCSLDGIFRLIDFGQSYLSTPDLNVHTRVCFQDYHMFLSCFRETIHSAEGSSFCQRHEAISSLQSVQSELQAILQDFGESLSSCTITAHSSITIQLQRITQTQSCSVFQQFWQRMQDTRFSQTALYSWKSWTVFEALLVQHMYSRVVWAMGSCPEISMSWHNLFEDVRCIVCQCVAHPDDDPGMNLGFFERVYPWIRACIEGNTQTTLIDRWLHLPYHSWEIETLFWLQQQPFSDLALFWRAMFDLDNRAESDPAIYQSEVYRVLEEYHERRKNLSSHNDQGSRGQAERTYWHVPYRALRKRPRSSFPNIPSKRRK